MMSCYLRLCEQGWLFMNDDIVTKLDSEENAQNAKEHEEQVES